ncbi:MAG TPA: hypothetical protein GXZ87_07325 [Bacteroidales bacterium]|nr:hypothetical protein [Bacteroidales bacterium]
MKKITFLSLFVSMFIVSVNAQNYFTDYGEITRTDRALTSISCEKNGAEYRFFEVNQADAGTIYFDMTDVIIEVEAGDELTFKYDWTGYWMHNVIYVDWNNDGVFSTDDDTELIGLNGEDAEHEMEKPIIYTLPADKEPGDYRIRMMVDWVVDGHSTNINSLGDKQPIARNGGSVVDATLRVKGTQETVATPVITPASGEYTTAQEITITTATEGASIYYTLDGSTPSAASTAYTAPFSLSQSCFVKAIAVKEGMQDSEIASAIYTFTLASVNDVDANKIYTFFDGNTLNVVGVEAGTSIAVYSVAGKLLVDEVASDSTHTINGLANDVYLVKAGTKTLKVVK